MKAGVVHAKNDIRFEKIKTPKPGKGQVKIKVKIHRHLRFGCAESGTGILPLLSQCPGA